jgi:hypothetical protein
MMDVSTVERCKRFSCQFLGDTKLDEPSPSLIIFIIIIIKPDELH